MTDLIKGCVSLYTSSAQSWAWWCEIKYKCIELQFRFTLSGCWPKNFVELENFTCILQFHWITDHYWAIISNMLNWRNRLWMKRWPYPAEDSDISYNWTFRNRSNNNNFSNKKKRSCDTSQFLKHVIQVSVFFYSLVITKSSFGKLLDVVT
jgi:hypothetical protein